MKRLLYYCFLLALVADCVYGIPLVLMPGGVSLQLQSLAQATDGSAPGPNAPSPAPNAPTPAPNAPTPAPNAPSPAPNAPTPAPNAPTPAPNAPSPAPNAPTPAPNAPSPAPRAPAPTVQPPTPPAPPPSTPAPSPVPETKPKNGLNGGQKAGIAIGVIAGAGILGVAGFVYKKRQTNLRRARYGDGARRVELGSV